ncbi:MAG: leucine-rich repeat domain-containing protein [Muribaculaceae bacterium]|nr:leucine-rich repeat domain-containing protein [Muribaculaceae bacterium]
MKKLLLTLGLFAAMTAAQAADFSATLLGGEFFFDIIDEEAATCEFAANPNGPYNVTLTGPWMPSTVTYNDKEYTIIGVGVEAFKDGYVTNGANNNTARQREFWGFPTSLTYVRADAFNGFRSNFPALLRGNVTEFDVTAMRNNKIAAINAAGQGGTYVSTEQVSGYTVNAVTDTYTATSAYAASAGSIIYKVLDDGGKLLVAYPGDHRRTYHHTYQSGVTIFPLDELYDQHITVVNATDYVEIGENAFYGNEYVERVDFCDTLTTIGAHAFENSVLTSLTLPATLTTIGEDAFKGVTTLTSITCNVAVPPVVTFEPEVYVLCKDKVTVPAEYEAAYRADEIWGPFFSPAYEVTVAETENGTVTADNYFAKDGDVITLTVTPDGGYELDQLTVVGSGEPLEISAGDAEGTYTFTMPGEAVTVTATFALLPPPTFTITVADGILNGTIAADKAEAAEGETVTLTITPDEGYELLTLSVTAEGIDELVLVDENNQFVMPAANVLINAEFAEVPVVESTITFDAAPQNGTVAVYIDNAPIESGAAVAEGTTVTVVLTPAEGYKVASFTVETVDEQPAPGLRRASVPVTDEGENTYSFQMPSAPIALNVEFTEDTSTAISDLNAAEGQVTYVNVMGQTANRPFNGVNIVMQGGKAIGKLVIR